MIIAIDNGPTLYHAGDTPGFSDMKLIGGSVSARPGHVAHRRSLHHGPETRRKVPQSTRRKDHPAIHWGTFPPLIGTPAALEKELAGSGITVIHTDPGKTLS